MKVTEIKSDVTGFTGQAKLYKCEPPFTWHDVWDDDAYNETTEYIVVSAVSNLWATETYIFPSDSEGKVTDYGELPGSFQGGTAHDAAIAGFLAHCDRTGQ